LPVGGGLLYVEPIYVSGTAGSSYPLSRVVVVAFGDKLAWSDTLTGALDGLFGGNAGAVAGDSGSGGTTTPPSTGPTGSTGSSTALSKALADAQRAYAAGQDALKKGDFAAYGQAQKDLQDAIARAVAAQPKGGSVTVSPSPSASPSSAPSPSATAKPSGTATGTG